MSKRAIKLWAIVVTIFTLGIVATYVILGNNGSSVSNNVSSNATQENANTSNILPSQESLEDTEQGQGSGDYYYWSIMPLRLQSKLPNPRSSAVLDYYYSKELGIAFSYEVVSLVDKNKFLTISVPEQGSNDNKIYLHNFEESKESGQSIEVINIEDNFRFSTIAEIISLQLLDEKQRISCKVDQKNNKYFVIAKDPKIKDSIPICGKYAKGNNRFFITPIQDGTAINKLLFVNAGDKEISFDGSGNSKYWYESVILE